MMGILEWMSLNNSAILFIGLFVRWPLVSGRVLLDQLDATSKRTQNERSRKQQAAGQFRLPTGGAGNWSSRRNSNWPTNRTFEMMMGESDYALSSEGNIQLAIINLGAWMRDIHYSIPSFIEMSHFSLCLSAGSDNREGEKLYVLRRVRYVVLARFGWIYATRMKIHFLTSGEWTQWEELCTSIILCSTWRMIKRRRRQHGIIKGGL